MNVKLHDTSTLDLIFNMDGFSPFKSSSLTVWPILCKIYAKEDVYEPFSVAVYAGKAKPKSSKDYLEKLISDQLLKMT